MSIDRKKLDALLKWYFKAIGEELIATIVVDREGLILASKSREDKIDEETIGGLSSLIEPVLKRITQEFSSGNFGTGTFDTEEHRLIFCEAGEEAIFISILDAIAMIDPVFPYSYLTAEKIARIFDGREVSPVIPNLYKTVDSEIIERKQGALRQISFKSEEYAFKLILGGDGGVGKTSMVMRFVHNEFEENYKATIGTNIMKKECEFNDLNTKVRFVIWDLAGQSQFARVRKTYLQNAEVGLLVFDVTNKASFKNIKKWYKEILDGSKGITLILVGNKIDLIDQRVVSKEEGESLANELNLSYFETSAKEGSGVLDTFKMLALQIIEKFLVVREV
jgi:Ras-related protein Rab-8A